MFWLVGILTYCASAALTYSEPAKSKWWYVPLGMLFGLITNFAWMNIAKRNLDRESLYFQALVWDILIVLIFALLPILFMGVRLNQYQLFGAFLVTLGLVLFKL